MILVNFDIITFDSKKNYIVVFLKSKDLMKYFTNNKTKTNK